MNEQQAEKLSHGAGFIAALDQSGGSTPKALASYGVVEDSYSGDEEMFAAMHAFRSRIMTAPAFTGDKLLAAILFEDTMDREVEGKPSASYLWEDKTVVPILKVDKGLADTDDGVQLMKPIGGLDDLLGRAVAKGIFGTKMRSVVKTDDAAGIAAIVDQQFEIGGTISAAGLVPILEPEVDIHSETKQGAEKTLKDNILTHLDAWDRPTPLMLKLTIPTEDDFYADLIEHPKVLRVVALSGGYSQAEADERLARNHGLIASFSRALTEGLFKQQSDEEFDAVLAESIDHIYAASIT